MVRPIFGVFNLGGGEVVLVLGILAFLAILAVGMALLAGLVFVIVRSAKTPVAAPSPFLTPEMMVQNQRRRDGEQLKLLSIFHFVLAGIAVFGMLFLLCHFLIMHAIFTNPEGWKNSKNGGPPPAAIFDALVWIYLFAGFILIAAIALNALSGIFIWKRTHRMFSLVVGGLNCVQFPFGTALGTFTLIVLLRDSVRELYSAAAAR